VELELHKLASNVMIITEMMAMDAVTHALLKLDGHAFLVEPNAIKFLVEMGYLKDQSNAMMEILSTLIYARMTAQSTEQ